jgi:uncharacterized damage-inducible protein DinB
MMRDNVTSIEHEYRRYEKLAEEAFAQATDAELAIAPAADGNSIVVVAWHVSGNLKSRFTDFLTSDGEKPWRDRESEFVDRTVTRAELLARWAEGWAVLFATLGALTDADLSRAVTIRGEAMSVLQALHRSVTHTAYHVGQIVLLAKSFRGAGWRSLTIPRGGIRR